MSLHCQPSAADTYHFKHMKQNLYELYRRQGALTTDSRDCPEGSIFFALKGESFDGNKFAASALEKGCAYAVVDDATAVPEGDNRYILVDDVTTALQHLARDHRRQFNIPVVGITGTNGKTTTKELVSRVLAEQMNVLATEGNFNNDIGVPKTLLRINDNHDIAVIEMGASHPGDIRRLVETAEPTCGLITNVGKAHLQGFGSFEGVCRTKGELYDFLRTREDSVVFINSANPHLMAMAQNLTLIDYASSPAEGLYVEGEVISCAPTLTFRWRHAGGEWHRVESQLIGAYNIDNMLAATAVGLYFGIEPENIDHALTTYRPTNNRSQLTLTERNRLVVDAYNANPTSMAAAIDNFRRMEVSPKMVILGQMGELGASSYEEHVRVVEMLDEAQFDKVWLVGSEFAFASDRYRVFKNVEEVKQTLKTNSIEGQNILIKGSNFTRLYQLPELL